MLRRGQRSLMHAENNILIQRNVIKGKNCVSMAILSPDHHERILYSGLMLKRNLLWFSSDPVPPYGTRSLRGPRRGAHPEPGSSRNSLSEQPGPSFGHVQAFTLGSFSQGQMDPAVTWPTGQPGYCLGWWRAEPGFAGWS